MIILLVKFLKMSVEHLEMIRNWRNSPDVKKYMYTDQYITEKVHHNWYNRVKDDTTKVYWVIEVDKILVGLVNLYNIDNQNKRCYWAYYLADPSVRGKGLGRLIELNILSYVFENLGLNKLCCEILGFNDIVVKIHQKYGSKIEGNFRQHINKGGKFFDIVCMGILKEEWIDIKKNFEFEKILIEK